MDHCNIFYIVADCILNIVNHAHEIEELRQIKVVMGAYNLTDSNETGRVVADVKKIIIHDDFKPGYFDADLAILVLKENVKFNDYIRPVFLPNEYIASKTNGELISWSARDLNDTRISDLATRVHLSILPHVECIKKEPASMYLLNNRTFCTGEEGVYLTKGEAGHGFYIKHNGKYYLRGLASATSCNSCHLAIYTDIYKHMHFLDENNATNRVNRTNRAIISSDFDFEIDNTDHDIEDTEASGGEESDFSPSPKTKAKKSGNQTSDDFYFAAEKPIDPAAKENGKAEKNKMEKMYFEFLLFMYMWVIYLQ